MKPGADEGVAAGPFNTAVKGGLYSIPGSSAECSYGCWVPETQAGISITQTHQAIQSQQQWQ